MPDQTIELVHAPGEFRNWERLLAMLKAAFEYQEERIDPPSSVYALDVTALAEKARQEHMILAVSDADLVGCVFAAKQAESVYVSKLAVWPHLQGRGIGRLLMREVDAFARRCGRTTLELNTRIELVENHRTFEKLGYTKVAEHAHEGFDRPTFITMQRRLDA